MKRLKKLSWYYKKNFYKYILVILLSIAIIYINNIKPVLIGRAIDDIGLGRITEDILNELIFSLIVVFALKYILSFIKNVLLMNLFHKLYYNIRIRFMENLLRQDADYFNTYHPGDLMTRATGDTFSTTNVCTQLSFNFLTTILTIVMTSIRLFKTNVSLTLYSILPLPFIFIIILVIRPKISKNWKRVREKNSNMSNYAMESVQHVKLIRSFVSENDDCLKLKNSAKDCYNEEKKLVYLQSLVSPVFNFFTTISKLVAYGYGAFLVINQEITVGDLITFVFLLTQFANPMVQLGNQVTRFAQSFISFDRVFEILDATPEIVDKENSIDITKFDTICLKNYHFTYPNTNLEILKGIDLEIDKGKSLGIVGKTGSGKTTLIRQFLRLYPVSDSDPIYIDGIQINDYKKISVKNLFGYVPQEHVLFGRSVRENILMGLTDKSNISLEKAIEMADFKKDLEYLDDGLDTIVGEYGVTLSGGQKQRLSIARALIKDSEVLILDDSLSAVDGQTESNIIENLKIIRKDKTNIIIAHRLTAVKDCDNIIVLSDGKITESGTHEELIKNKGWYYRQYLEQEMGGEKDE